MDILRTGVTNNVTPQAGPPEHNREAAITIAPQSGENSPSVGSARGHGRRRLPALGDEAQHGQAP